MATLSDGTEGTEEKERIERTEGIEGGFLRSNSRIYDDGGVCSIVVIAVFK